MNDLSRHSVLHVRTVTGSGGGPDKTILRSARYADCEMAAAYIHPDHDPGLGSLRSEADRRDCPFIAIPESGAIDFATVRRLLGVCRERNVTIWHGHDYKSNVLGRMLRRLHPMKLVATVHGFITETRREKIYHRAENLALTGYDRVIAVSPPLVEHCARHGVHPDRICHIPNGIEIERYPIRTPPRNAIPIIGIVSRLSPEKGVDRAIDALAALPGVELHIVGDGPERRALSQRAHTLGVAHRVTIHGWQLDPRTYLKRFDALLLPSRTEGLPNVLLEAMAMGVPVAATAVGGVPHLLDHGQCGALLPGNESHWPEMISHTIRCGEQAVGKARQRIETGYTFAGRMRRVMQVYNSLSHRRPVRIAA